MTVHTKILSLLLISVTLYTILGAYYQRYFILPSFLALEAEEAQKNMDRCLDALERELHHLSIFCFDWAAWDDTYAYLETGSAAYQESNLSPASFIDNNLNMLYFFDASGQLVWGKFYNLETGHPVPFPDIPSGGLAATHPVLRPETRDESLSGILRTAKGPLLIASRPILPSEATLGEQARGTLIMGRLLNDALLAGIQSQAQVDLEVLPANHGSLPPEARALVGGETWLDYEDGNNLRVFATVDDVLGKPALMFVTRAKRDILARGRTAVRLLNLAAATAGLVFVVLLALFMRRLVSHPLMMLSEQARDVSLGTPPRPMPALRRKDEIGQLARDFHKMLRRLRDEESERNAAEKALRDSEARLNTILRTAPDAIVVTNSKGCIESANDAAARLFGYDVDTLIGMRGRDLLAEDEREYWIDAVAGYAKNPTPEPFTANRESAILDRNGDVHPVHMCVSSVMLDGTPHFISAVRDISSVKELQAHIARQRRLATIGEMGATVAHEIRNPLAGMRGAIHLMQQGTLAAADQKEALDGLSESVDRIAHTVDQLLQYARPITPRFESFPLRPLLEAVVDAHDGPDPQRAQVKITCADQLQAYGDVNLLRQVLENLWSNARQAAGPAGHFVWIARMHEDNLVISLADNGPGVDPSVQGQIFDPFFTTRVDGTGLGLAISLRIIEAHHGTIRMQDNEPAGTQVTVTLPGGAA